jgi:lysyl-tRNA synthetase class 2
MLRLRSQTMKQIRNFFDARNFIEVETPIVSNDIVVDRYLEPISIPQSAVTSRESSTGRFWLQTSPEFAMKRLLASGATAIYQITKAFRAGELGHHHNPEFTMLEWYRVGDDYRAGMDLLAEFARQMFGVAEAKQIAYREAFMQFAGIDPFVDAVDRFRDAARTQAIEFAGEGADLDFWRNVILSQVVEPRLGNDLPTIIYDWPATQSALAKIRDGDPPVAERFELFYRGMELANGYHELTDADELESRNRQANEVRRQEGKLELPEDSRLLHAMRAGLLPDCSGVALGIDRMMMVLSNSANICDVIAFPIGRA